MDGTMTINPKGMSRSQERRYLAQQAKAAKGTERRDYLSEIQALRQLRDRMRVQYCSEPRLEAATDARCTPLPGVACECPACHYSKRQWPSTYLVPVRVQGTDMRGEVSYECYLHSQSEWFLEALPSSSSIVRFQ
jgi:hypothetical protein